MIMKKNADNFQKMNRNFDKKVTHGRDFSDLQINKNHMTACNKPLELSEKLLSVQCIYAKHRLAKHELPKFKKTGDQYDFSNIF